MAIDIVINPQKSTMPGLKAVGGDIAGISRVIFTALKGVFGKLITDSYIIVVQVGDDTYRLKIAESSFLHRHELCHSLQELGVLVV